MEVTRCHSNHSMDMSGWNSTIGLLTNTALARNIEKSNRYDDELGVTLFLTS